jgi:hypothetical protein
MYYVQIRIYIESRIDEKKKNKINGCRERRKKENDVKSNQGKSSILHESSMTR